MDPHQQNQPIPMETSLQQNPQQQKSLPIKTKIAAWLMTIIGFPFLAVGLFALLMGGMSGCQELAILPCIIAAASLSLGIPLALPSIILLKLKKKWLWFLVLISYPLSFMVLYLSKYKPNLNSFTIFFTIYVCVPVIISFSLLLIDCKNFWKVAR